MIAVNDRAYAMASVLWPRGGAIPCSDGFVPCSNKENSLFRSTRELRPRARNRCVIWRQQSPKSPKIHKFPVIFPVFRESRTFQGDDPISSDRLIVDICKHRD